MPSSAKDRFTIDFDYLFFFVKSKSYWFETQYEAYQSVYDNYSYNGKATKNYKDAKAQNPSDSKRRILKSMKNNSGRIKRTVWKIPTSPFSGVHFAVFPEKLIETPINAGCPPDGIVLDPFMGSGTTAVVAKKLNRNFIGIDLNIKYCEMANKRLVEMLP
jgi:site-specific DNA-methyltransferase (adenine-specific)